MLHPHVRQFPRTVHPGNPTNRTIALGNSWTALDAVLESKVRSQIVTFKEMLNCHCSPSEPLMYGSAGVLSV
jgi:hypothetical protein